MGNRQPGKDVGNNGQIGVIARIREGSIAATIGTVFGSLLVAAIWAFVSYWGEKPKSLLPPAALGDILLFSLVELAPAGANVVERSIEDQELKITAGEITVANGSVAISRLSIRAANGEELVAGRNVPLFGATYGSRINLNCYFRLDVMTSAELFKENAVIISIESWSISEDQPPCSVRFGNLQTKP